MTVNSLLGYHGPAPHAAGELLPRQFTVAVLATDAPSRRCCSGLSAGYTRAQRQLGTERVAILQECDEIVVTEIKNAGLYNKIWQSFAVLLPVSSVGVMGDMRTYAATCAVRAVHSEDGMTADWVQLPYDLLATISQRIVNEVRGINRVVYDISSKPPATIEWE